MANICHMTQDLFRQDAYLTECTATVTAVTELGIVLDRTVFYPLGGGQAGDAGTLVLADGTTLTIADTRKGKDAEGKPTADIVHVPAPGQEAALAALKTGDALTARIDWERRHKLMRFHTATHLLCRVVPQLVNGVVRTIHIGDTADAVDLQPCGGTHVANTREIGAVVVTKIEKKSAMTRRVVLGFA